MGYLIVGFVLGSLVMYFVGKGRIKKEMTPADKIRAINKQQHLNAFVWRIKRGDD